MPHPRSEARRTRVGSTRDQGPLPCRRSPGAAWRDPGHRRDGYDLRRELAESRGHRPRRDGGAGRPGLPPPRALARLPARRDPAGLATRRNVAASPPSGRPGHDPRRWLRPAVRPTPPGGHDVHGLRAHPPRRRDGRHSPLRGRLPDALAHAVPGRARRSSERRRPERGAGHTDAPVDRGRARPRGRPPSRRGRVGAALCVPAPAPLVRRVRQPDGDRALLDPGRHDVRPGLPGHEALGAPPRGPRVARLRRPHPAGARDLRPAPAPHGARGRRRGPAAPRASPRTLARVGRGGAGLSAPRRAAGGLCAVHARPDDRPRRLAARLRRDLDRHSAAPGDEERRARSANGPARADGPGPPLPRHRARVGGPALPAGPARPRHRLVRVLLRRHVGRLDAAPPRRALAPRGPPRRRGARRPRGLAATEDPLGRPGARRGGSRRRRRGGAGQRRVALAPDERPDGRGHVPARARAPADRPALPARAPGAR